MSNLLSQASLVMIPSGYKEDVVYSAIPTNGNGDLSFTRASNGTRINSAGLVEVCPWNLVQYSEDFSNGNFWGASNESLTTNATLAPNGTTTADLLIPSAGTGDHYLLSGTVSNQVGEGITLSLFVKKKENDYFYFGTGGASAFGAVVYRFSTNTFTVSGLSATATDFGNGWIRLSITGTTGATDLRLLFTPTDSTGSRTYNANGTDGTYIWGAQANIGSTAKPYFPTTDRLNVPRLTYQNGGGGCPSLLLEKQSTNIALYSENWETNTSGFSGGAFSANQTNSPDGTQNADKFTVNSSTSTHGGYYGATGTASAIYSVSAFIKAGTGRYFLFRAMTDSFTTRYGVTIDLQTGTILSSNTQGSPTGTSSKIEDFGNGWYRVTLTMNTIGTQIAGVWGASNTGTPSLQTDLDYSYAGNGTDSYYMWGMQTEQSSYPTSYIPTTSSSATRVADACLKTGIGSLIGQTEGTLFFEGSQIAASTSVPFQLSDTTNANRVQIEIASTGAPLLVATSGGFTVAVITGSAYTVGQNRKIAVTYKNNDFRLYQNGVLIGSDTSGSVPLSLTAIYLGSEAGTPYLNLEIKQIVNFKTSLTDAECIALTTI